MGLWGMRKPSLLTTQPDGGFLAAGLGHGVLHSTVDLKLGDAGRGGFHAGHDADVGDFGGFADAGDLQGRLGEADGVDDPGPINDPGPGARHLLLHGLHHGGGGGVGPLLDADTAVEEVRGLSLCR